MTELILQKYKAVKYIHKKSSIQDARMGSKYTSAFWRLFKRFSFLKDFSLQASWNLLNLIIFLKYFFF